MISIDDAKELADQVNAAVGAFNKAISNAAIRGLIIKVEVLNVAQFAQSEDVPLVNVTTTIRPSNLTT